MYGGQQTLEDAGIAEADATLRDFNVRPDDADFLGQTDNVSAPSAAAEEMPAREMEDGALEEAAELDAEDAELDADEGFVGGSDVAAWGGMSDYFSGGDCGDMHDDDMTLAVGGDSVVGGAPFATKVFAGAALLGVLVFVVFLLVWANMMVANSKMGSLAQRPALGMLLGLAIALLSARLCRMAGEACQ